ncbi:hypothetical protein [Streptomyces sp. NPDC020983]|uniref:hypothetical protein n=1 Tax=Streptomyces sp. NPDC020983 TaxID=3365106 RepID=UPI0037AB31B4
MSVMGVWVVGAVADGAVEEAHRRFPDAARAHGVWPEPPAGARRWRERFGPAGTRDGAPPAGTRDGTPGQPSHSPLTGGDIARFADAVDRARTGAAEADELQEHLLRAVPQQEGDGLFCSAVPRGDGAAALLWGLGPDAVFGLPGCCGQFLCDAASVRAALPAAERALVLSPPRRSRTAARIRLWLDETADDPNCDIDELIDGPLRVLRHAARTGAGAVGLTLWY